MTVELARGRASCGVQTCWGFPALLPPAVSVLPPERFRTHCPPEKRGDKCEETGPFFSPGSERFFPQAIFLICSGSQEKGGEEWVLGTYDLILWFAFGHAAA